MDENTNNSSDVANQQITSQINDGFSQNNERFDEIVAYMQDHNSQESEEHNEILLAIQEDQEDTESQEQEADVTDYNEEVIQHLQSIEDQIIINNGLVGGFYFVFGIITSILLFKIIWDKMRV